MLVGAESAGLFEQTIDKGGFAVIDVGYDRNISYVLHFLLVLRDACWATQEMHHGADSQIQPDSMPWI